MNNRVVIGDNNTVLLFIRSFVRSFVDIYKPVSTTEATTGKFEEIKEKEKTESEKL